MLMEQVWLTLTMIRMALGRSQLNILGNMKEESLLAKQLLELTFMTLNR